MADLNPPISFAGEQGTLGHSYLFAQQAILLELQDALNVLDIGLMPLVGEFAGSGTDTMRVTHMGNVGFSVPFDALATETDAVTPKRITAGYSTIALGMYGLGHSETYKHQILGREGMTQLDALKQFVPQSWLRTLRDLYCDAGSGIATDIGSASAALSIDDMIDLVTVFREALGSGVRGAPTMTLDPAQVTQVLASARLEPAFQNSVADFSAVQGLTFGQVAANFLGLGFRCVMTDSVNQSGGGYQGFAHSFGGIGWGVASTGALRTANPQGTILVPEFGLVIEEDPSLGRNGQRGYSARSLIGVALGDTSNGIHVQRRILSVV